MRYSQRRYGLREEIRGGRARRVRFRHQELTPHFFFVFRKVFIKKIRTGCCAILCVAMGASEASAVCWNALKLGGL